MTQVNKKKVWLLEQINQPLTLQKPSETTDKRVMLVGICADFNGENENGRLYDKEDYLSQFDYLLPQIKEGILFGSADHDEDYMVSMKDVSHIIRDLWYDEEKNQCFIKIEIIPTHFGKDLIAIVEAGSPLYISSRASGYVNEDNGSVAIEQIYTFDVVYKPGFKNAKLKRIYENRNFGNNHNVAIYEWSEPNKINKDNNTKNTDMEKYVKEEDFNKFSKNLTLQIDGLKKIFENKKIAEIKKGSNFRLNENENEVNYTVVDADNNSYYSGTNEEEAKKALDSNVSDDVKLTLFKNGIAVINEDDFTKPATTTTEVSDEQITALIKSFEQYKQITDSKLDEVCEKMNEIISVVNSLEEHSDMVTDHINRLEDSNDVVVDTVNAVKDETESTVSEVLKLKTNQNNQKLKIKRLEESYDNSVDTINEMIDVVELTGKENEVLKSSNDLIVERLNKHTTKFKKLYEEEQEDLETIKSTVEETDLPVESVEQTENGEIKITLSEPVAEEEIENFIEENDLTASDLNGKEVVIAITESIKKLRINRKLNEEFEDGKIYTLVVDKNDLKVGSKVTYKSESGTFTSEDGKDIGKLEPTDISESKKLKRLFESKHIDKVISNTNKKKDMKSSILLESKYPFLKETKDSTKKLFENLSEIKKKKVTELILENEMVGDDGVKLAIGEVESDRDITFLLDKMPEQYQPIWSSLSKDEKNQVITLFRSKNPSTEDEVELFWVSLGLENYVPNNTNDDDNQEEVEIGDENFLGYSVDDINI